MAGTSTTTNPIGATNRHAAKRNSRGRTRGEPQTFDFRRPSTLSREHVRTMQIVQETLARGFTTALASTLRAVVQVSIDVIEQRPYDEYIRQIPNPTMLTMLSLRPLSGAAMLQIPLPVAYAITELMLGGAGGPEQPRRAMSDLELSLMRGIVEQTMPEFRYAFEPVVNIEPSIVAQESNPQFAQIAAPTDMMVIVSFELRIEQVTGTMHLVLPYSGLQPHLEALSAAARMGAESSEKMQLVRERLKESISDAGLTTNAVFRRARATSRQIVELQVGDLLLLNHPVAMPLTLEAGGVPVYDVSIGRVNRQLGLQVVGSVPPDRRRRTTSLHVIPADGAAHDTARRSAS